MFKKPIQAAYGLKLISFWILIPFVLMLIVTLGNEFRNRMTVQDVILKEETLSRYPDDYSSFKTELNGKEFNVNTSKEYKEGDTVTIILKNGEYYMTPDTLKIQKSYSTFFGRVLRVSNNLMGYIIIGASSVCLITFLLTFKKTKDLRKEYPKLSKVTNISGIISAAIMSGLFIFAVIEGSLNGLCAGIFGVILGIIYTAVFLLVWMGTWAIYAFALKE